jgi:hypothetical protein
MTRVADNYNATLPAFSDEEFEEAKLRLATLVAHMMGRKLGEDDWNKVYCEAKGIPHTGWSNLNIDVNHQGLGVDQKLLRVSGLRGKPIQSVCGTTMMHPAATRSIRIDDTDAPADDVMRDVFTQYADLIEIRQDTVLANAGGNEPDLRTGWLLWEDELTEFLYFEEPLTPPDANDFYARWNETPARGARKGSKSLWIYERETNKKRYSVTTSAGIKIQPYFDVPSPSDSNLYYFRVQAEPIDYDTVQIWVSATTAQGIEEQLGSLDKDVVSDAISQVSEHPDIKDGELAAGDDLARPIRITPKAFEILKDRWDGVSDEHRAQLFLGALRRTR